MKMLSLCFILSFGILAFGGSISSMAQTATPTDTPTQTPTPTPTLTPMVQSLFPIAVNFDTLASAVPGDAIADILDGGGQPGNIGWLSWTGNPSSCTLCKSLTPPGDSNTYINPEKPDDRQIDVGDFIAGSPGVHNSSCVRSQLDNLISSGMKIGIPAWDIVNGQGGNNALFRTRAFALVQITSYQIPKENSISAIFWGWTGLQANGAAPTEPVLSMDVSNGNASDVNTDDAVDANCLAIVSPESNPQLRWRILPNPGMNNADIIAGVLLPNGKIMVFDAGFRTLHGFNKIANAPRVARSVSFSRAQDGVVTLSVGPNNSGGPFIIVAGVLSPGSNTLLLRSQSNPFMIR